MEKVKWCWILSIFPNLKYGERENERCCNPLMFSISLFLIEKYGKDEIGLNPTKCILQANIFLIVFVHLLFAMLLYHAVCNVYNLCNGHCGSQCSIHCKASQCNTVWFSAPSLVPFDSTFHCSKVAFSSALGNCQDALGSKR